MAVWIPVGDEFIEADVIRWSEAVFKDRRRGRPARLGERLVIAEVLREPDKDGWVYLLVRGGEVVSAHMGWNPSDVPLPAKDNETRRRLRTIVRGKAERLVWSDESARAIVAGQFLGNPNPILLVSTDMDENSSLRSSFNPVSRASKSPLGKPGWELPGPHG
jgi:hypothetical protein